MGKIVVPPGSKWCAQCKAVKPLTAFADPPKGYRVTICMTCARENVARWKRTQMVGRLPGDFSEKDE